VTARRVDRLEELAREIERDGGTCVPIALDVTDDESIVQAVAHATEALGLVDILVNNAGIPDAQRAHKMSLELTDAVLDTNVRGPWLLANEVGAGAHRS
jgi:NADP-dependent 3-hydroxy acid dehydrogenase YdfG